MVDIPINAVHRRVQYTSSGTTGPYSFTFETLAEADLAVYSGSTLQTLTTDYTVSLNANGTGSVTMVASSTGVIITILSNRAIARTADYTTGGDFTAASINLELDSLAISDQQLESWFRRSVQLDDFANRDVSSSGAGPLTFPYEDTVLDQAEKYIRYDSAGTALESVALTTISALAVPGTTVDNALARWSGLTGSTLDDSAATLDDNDLLTAPGGFAGNKGSDIASATALVIGTDGDRFDVTGTTTVTSMTTAIGRYFTLQFDGAVLLTNGASLVLPGAANITTAAGDRFTFVATAANTVECISYARASGLAIAVDADTLKADTADTLTTKFTTAHTSASSSSNVVTLDFTSTPKYKTTLTENITTVTISNTTDGDELQWVITGATGPFTVAGWAAAGLTIEWPGDAAPTISLSASEYAIISATRVGTILLMDSKVTFGVA